MLHFVDLPSNQPAENEDETGKETVVSSSNFKAPPAPVEKFPNAVLTEKTVFTDQPMFTSPETEKPPVQNAKFKAENMLTAENKQTSSPFKFVLAISLTTLLLVIAVGGPFIYQKVAAWTQSYQTKQALFSGLSKQDMELLLEDANPMALKRLSEDPEVKKQQIDNLKQMFALANQAVKDGLADEEYMPKVLEIVDATVWASTYDREINKASEVQYSAITDKQVKDFYGEAANQSAVQKQNTQDFDEFFKVQMAFAVKNKTISEDTNPSEEEKNQTREQFARIKIYEKEAKAKVQSKALPEKFARKVALQSKLQKVQLLSRMYSERVLTKKTEVTDAEIQKYISEHPELNTDNAKKQKALEILQRVKNKEDFAKLADQFSEDPSTKGKGGLYENIEVGQFTPELEKAALALEPGQIAPELVKTPFGYHIVKLEKKGEIKDASGQIKKTYSLRHILFSTMIIDPENPMGREQPVNDYVKQKLEDLKEKEVMNKLVADNPVSIAEDFTIPKISDEDIQRYIMNQQKEPQKEAPPSPNSNSATNSNRGNFNR